MRAPTRICLLAALACAIAAGPAHASVTLGDADTGSDACGTGQVLVQRKTAGVQVYRYTSQTPGVIVSWSYEGHASPANARLRVYHETASTAIWFTRSESALKTAGSGAGQVHANQINTFPESPGIPIREGDVLGLTGSGGGGISCHSTSSGNDELCTKSPPDPAVGQNAGGWFCGVLTNLRLGVSAVVEPDADGDNFGDESQDSCPTDPAVHTGACPVDLSIVKTASPNPKVGQNLIYGLSVKNNSATNPAAGTTVIDTLPSGVTFVSAAASQGSCSGTATVICGLGTLGPGQTAIVAIVVKPTSTGVRNNTAGVTTTANETDTTNNSSSVLVNVGPPLPVVTKLKLKPTSFTAAAGAQVSYKLNTAAKTTFSVQKPTSGIKSGGKCVKPPKNPPAGAKKCTRFVSIGSFKRTDAAGARSFHFNAKAKGKTLKAGSYRLQAVARNKSGASKPKQTGFRIK